MIWENLKDTLVQTDLMAENEQEIFEQLGGVLVSEGCCKESYVSALSEREKVYPTGILAGDIGVAIPHTDPCYVETTGIAIGVLKEPVSFFQMGTNPKEKCESPGQVCHDAGNRRKTAFGSASESHSFNSGCRGFENACKRRESGGNYSNHQK